MNAFEWMNVTSVAEAVNALKSVPAPRDPDEAARPIAGGQDILTTMKDYITRPPRVVNLKGTKGLDKLSKMEKGAADWRARDFDSTRRKPARSSQFSGPC